MTRAVIVKQVSPSRNSRQAAEFLRQLAESMASVVRPCVVLDCSQVRRIDNAFLHLLLCSLEEAMKRNGDVRLSGIPDAARPALESIGIDRLFQFFPSVTEATESFRRASIPAIPNRRQDSSSLPSARAA